MKNVTEAGETAMATNAMGASSSTSGPIQLVDPLLGRKKLKKYSQMFKRKELESGSK